MEVQVSKRLPATRISIERIDLYDRTEWDMWLYIDRFPSQLITTYKHKRDSVRGACRLSKKLVRPIPSLHYDYDEIDIYLEGRLIA